jgi:hypothetical protein
MYDAARERTQDRARGRHRLIVATGHDQQGACLDRWDTAGDGRIHEPRAGGTQTPLEIVGGRNPTRTEVAHDGVGC